MFKIVTGFREAQGFFIANVAMSRGYFVDVTADSQVDGNTPGVLELATSKFIGPLLQDVTAAGISYINKVNNVPVTTVSTGNPVTVACGGGYIVTSLVAAYGAVGAITDSLAHDTELEVYNGLWREAQGTYDVKGRLVGLWDGTSGQYHIEVFA